MDKYGLIGFPLGHSFSRKYFRQKFSQNNIDAEFNNYEIENIKDFPELLRREPNIKGLSVTIPYKESIIKYLDELSPEAKTIGAVNSIKVIRNRDNIFTKGFNTDTFGFKKSLLSFAEENIKGIKALILGTGGAAKAVAYTLMECNIAYKLVSRNPKQGELSYHQLKKYIENYHLIINTTPLGMYPNIESFPNIPYKKLNKDYFLFDLTYNPELTSFLSKGKNRGANIINGIDMLYLQAEKSWLLWNN